MIIQGIIFATPGFRYCNINLFNLMFCNDINLYSQCNVAVLIYGLVLV